MHATDRFVSRGVEMLLRLNRLLRLLVDSRLLAVAMRRSRYGSHWAAHLPDSVDDPFVALIAMHRPELLAELCPMDTRRCGSRHRSLSRPCSCPSERLLFYRIEPSIRFRPLPQYPPPEERSLPSLVLGESHHPLHPAALPNRTGSPFRSAACTRVSWSSARSARARLRPACIRTSTN